MIQNPPADLISVVAGSLVVILGLITALFKQRRNGKVAESAVAALREYQHDEEEREAVAQAQRRIRDITHALDRIEGQHAQIGAMQDQLKEVGILLGEIDQKIDDLKKPNGQGKVA